MVTCRVNGQMRQMASTRDMVFNVSTLIAYISSVMTLEPGDIIFTGTPAGVGELKNGDVVDVEIEGLGKLSNPVKNRLRPCGATLLWRRSNLILAGCFSATPHRPRMTNYRMTTMNFKPSSNNTPLTKTESLDALRKKITHALIAANIFILIHGGGIMLNRKFKNITNLCTRTFWQSAFIQPHFACGH